MLDWLKHIPTWLLVTLTSLVVFVLSVCLIVAIGDGRRVDLGPLTIYESTSDDMVKLENKIAELEGKLKYLQSHWSEAKVLAKLPEPVRAKNLDASIEKINELIVHTNTQVSVNSALKQKLEAVEKVDGTFLYKLLIFNEEAACYGASLNFTAGKDRSECLPKAQLAARFLEFLSEIDFYVATSQATTAEAKKQLLRLQEKYQFNTKGWYGPDVFKSIISEFYNQS